MKNKLLLASIASTIAFTSVANARDYRIHYYGPNNFSVNEIPFSSYKQVFQYLTSPAVSFKNGIDSITTYTDEDRNLRQDFLINDELRNNVINTFATFRDINLNDDKINELTNTLNIFSAALNRQTAELKNSILEDDFDLELLINDNDDQFSQNFIHIVNKMVLTEDEKAQLIAAFSNLGSIMLANSTYTEVNDNIANTFYNSDLHISDKEIIKEYIDLIKKEKREGNLSVAQRERVKILEEELEGEEFKTLKDKPQTSENLKNIQRIIDEDASLSDPEKVSDALTVFNKMKDLYLTTDVKDATKVGAVQKSDTAVTESLISSLTAIRGIIDSRIGSAGVASGDFIDTKGVWVQGSFTTGQQKAHGNAPGYKFNQKGFTVGADAGDEAMLGLAYSYYINDVKNKANSKNKEDITSHIATIYGKFNATNEVFLKAQGQYGKASIKKERATGDLADNIAKAKTKATITSAKLEVGYDFALDANTHLIPTAGLSYTNIGVKGYSENKVGLYRTIGKRTTNRTSGLVGISAAYNVDIDSNIKLLPEVHANLDYAFKTKNSATTVTIIKGIDPISTPSEKLAKAYYNIGASLKSIHNDQFEATISYDLGLSKKFQSHTGALKLRVNL